MLYMRVQPHWHTQINHYTTSRSLAALPSMAERSSLRLGRCALSLLPQHS